MHDFKKYRDFEDQAAVRMAADYLLKENLISGPVYAGYTGRAGLAPFVGVDDEAHYRGNVDAYRRSAPVRAGTVPA